MASTKGILEYLLSLERHGIKPGLGRVAALCRALGDPHSSFRSVHIAGTNGKGSVAAMTASVLSAAGLRTGLYTSPHLSRFNERISVSGRPITGRELEAAACEVRAALQKTGTGGVTFFEFTTAMAFLHFRKKLVDIAVVETGMGGRLDATNVVTPLVSVITNVGLDHAEWLGRTVKEIAFEKAGIIKPGVPVVTGETGRPALSVIRAAAKKASSPLFAIGRDFHAQQKAGSFSYSGLSGGLSGLMTTLHGPHQAKNAACALAAIELLRSAGVAVSAAAIRKGLKETRWPGRFETVSRRPLVILDCAHNPPGAKALAEALSGVKRRRLILVAGIMADKDIGGIFRELAPLCDEVIVTRPAGERAASLQVLVKAASRHGRPVSGVESVKEACKRAIKAASHGDAVCVTGSIFTVAEAREYLLGRRR